MSATRNSSLLLIAQVSLLFSGAVITVSLGRLLGPSLFGQYGILFAVATLLNLLLIPGMTQTISKFIAENVSHGKQLADSILLTQIGVGIAVSILYFGLTYPLAFLLRDPSLLPFLQLLTPLAFLHAVAAAYAGYVNGIGRFDIQAIQNLLYALFRPLTTLILAYYFLLTGAAWALVITSALLVSYYAASVRLTPRKSMSVQMVYRFALPMTLFSLLITLFLNVDLFMIKALLGDNAQAGYYTAASLIARIPYFLFTILGLMLMPAIAGTQREKVRPFVKSALRYVLIFAIPSSVALFVTATPAATLLYRSEYAQAGPALAVLSLGMLALTLSYLLGIVISALGRPYLPAFIVALMVAASAGIQFILIPLYGIVGGAIATSLISAVSLLVFYVVLLRMHGNALLLKSAIKLAIAALIMAPIGLTPLPNKFFLPLLYAAMGAVYLGLLVLFRELHRSDIEKLKDLIPKPILSLFNRIL